MISQHADDVIVLWITDSVNIDRLIIAPGLRWFCVLRAGRGRWGGGGGMVGGGGDFLVTEKKNSAKTSSWGLKMQTTKNKK